MKYEPVNILLADDDEDDRILFREALMNITPRHFLTTVDDGLKLMNHFKEKKVVPDFIFLDINMPYKNGMECLLFIKEMHPHNSPHIVMLSTSGAEEDINFSYTHGASAYIQKPGSFAELTKYIEHCLLHRHDLPERKKFFLNAHLSRKQI